MDKNVFTIQKAALYLGVSPDTLRRWEEKGILIPHRTQGNQRRYTKFQLDTYKKQKTVFTLQEASSSLGVSPDSLRRWEQKGHIASYRTPGNQRRYTAEQLGKLLPIEEPHEEQLYPVGIPPRPYGMTLHTEVPNNTLSELPTPEPPPYPPPIESHTTSRGFLYLLIAFVMFISLLAISAPQLVAALRSHGGAGLLAKLPFFGTAIHTNINNTRTGEIADVLGANTRSLAYIFSIHSPTVFSATVDVKQKLTIHSGLDTNNTDVNAGTGKLTARNVLYGLVAGNGITIGTGQTPTISATGGVSSLAGQTGAIALNVDSGLSIASGSGSLTFKNIDPGSAQKIFSTIAVQGGSSVTAGSNADTLTLVPGAGVTLTASGKSITIGSTAAASSWQLIGNDIYYNNGNVGVGTSTPSSLFDVGGTFKVNGSGAITAGSYQGTAVSTQYGGTGQNFSAIAQGSLLYFSGTGTLAALSPSGAAGFVLESQGDNANPVWVDITSALSNFWNETNGALSPIHLSDDFLIGGNSTASAKFGLINVASGTPTATISGTTGGVYLTADGRLATTNNQNLTVGGNTTGNIVLTPGNGTGSVTINGTANLSGSNVYQINGTTVLSATDLGSGVINSSLTKVGALTSGSIASGFGTIVTNNAISGSDLSATGSTGGLTFTGSGTHTVSATSGTLVINPFTLGGLVTGNSQSITGLGNVGIGTTTPLTQLDVTGSASLSGSISFRTNATHNINLLDNSSFNINRSVGGDTGLISAFFVDKGGNVGIGTTTPGSLFSISPSGATKFLVNSTGTIGFTGGSSFTQTFTSNAAAAKTYNFPDFVGSSADVCLSSGNCSGAGGSITGAGTSNYLAKFNSSSTLTAGSLYDNGNIGLGTTTPSALLDVNGAASISGQLALYGTPQIQSTASQTLTLGGNTTGNIVLTPGNGSGTVTISGLGTGPVHSTSGILSTSSINLASEVTGILPVANGGTGSPSLTANGVLFGNGTGALGVTTPGTDGQVFVGVTSGAPAFATLSGDATITNSGVLTLKNTGVGAGTLHTTAAQTPLITVDAAGRIVGVVNQAIAIDASQITSGILPIANGGTNNAVAYTAGSIIYSDGTKLTQDNSNLFYNSTTHSVGLGTTTPTAKLDVNGTAAISGQLSLYGTPQIQSTASQVLTLGGNTTGNIVLTPGNGTGTVKLTGYSAGVLHTNASGVISSSSVDLTTDVSGILLSTNGGTGLNSFGGPDQLLGVNSAHTALEYKDLSSLLTAGTGIGLSGTTTVTISNTGVTSIIGTTNQVTASSATGAVTLSLPQSIATSSTVRFANLGLGIAPITNLQVDGSTAGKALAILNYTGTDQDLLTASASGTTQFVVGNNGNIGFGANTGFLQTLTSNATAAKIYNLPNFSGPVADICLNTGNCSGAGSSLTGSGTTNYISKFTASQNLVSSTLYNDGNGNLGIGTTIPSGLFHVNGTNPGKALAIFNDTGTNQNILTASQSGVTKFNVTSTGNIGFAGNSSFINTLTTTATAARTYVLPDPGQTTADICLSTGNCAGAGGVVAGTGTTNYIPIWTSSTGISSSNLYQLAGNIGLGTTTPTAKLDVNGTASISGELALYGTPQIQSTANQTLTIGGSTTGDIQFTPQGTSSLRLANGNIYAYGTVSGVTDLTASGTITFSGITNGVARITSGVLSTGQVDLSQNTDVTNLLGINHGGTGVGNLVTGGMLYGNGGASSSYNKLLPGTSGQVLTMSGGIPTWIDASGLTTSYWTLNAGTLSPINSSLDLLVGGTSSTSAKFAFINNNSGTPTASISGNITLNSLGVIATTNKQSLTLGDTNTGSIIFNGGNVGIGTTNPSSAKLDIAGGVNLSSGNAYSINAVSVLTDSTLGSGVTASSLQTVGVLTGGSIASGFGTIATGNTITGTTINGTTGINTGSTGGTQRIDASGNLVNIGTITATQFSTGVGILNLASGVALQVNGTSVIDSSRNLVNINTTQFNGLTYTWPGSQSAGALLQTNGTGGLSWTDLATATGNFWRQTNGAVYPANSTVDLLVGGASSTSAKFAFINTNSGTPTASISGNITLNSAGVIATTNKQTLTLGNTNTGNIILNGGNVGIGTTTPGQKLDISGNLSLTGLVTAGTWNGTAISSTYGGTGIDTHLSTGVPTISTGTWSVQPQLSTQLGGTGQNWSAIAQGSVPYFSATGTMAALAPGTAGFILTTNGAGVNPSWQDPSTLAGGSNLFALNNGAIAPKNSTVDFLIGAQASTSAKFAVLNVNSGNPTASLSGNLALGSPTGGNPAAFLNILNGGTFNLQTSVGGDSGLASALYVSNTGNIGIGTTSPSAGTLLDVEGNATITAGGSTPTLNVRGNGAATALNVAAFGTGDGFYSSSSGNGNAITGWYTGSNSTGKGVYGIASSGYAGYFNGAGTAYSLVVPSGAGNVGIGTVSPSSLLSVGSSSQFQVNSSGSIAAATGISSSGTIAFSGLSTNGLVKTTGGTGTLAVATAGTDYENPLTFTNGLTRTSNSVALGGTLTGATTIANGGFNFGFTGTGNVGIGTTGPISKLEVSAVNPDLRLSTTGGSNGLVSSFYLGGTLASGATTANTAGLIQSGFSGGTTDTSYLSLNTINAAGNSFVEALRVTNAGNVGIGTINPLAKLSIGSTSQFQVNSSGTIAAATGISSSGTIAFSGLSTNGLVKTTGGTGTLAVATAGTDYESPLTFTNGLTRTSNSVALGGTLTGNTTIANAGFNFLVTGTGNVGIGNTAPGTKLDVSLSGNATQNTIRQNVTGSALAISSPFVSGANYLPGISWYTTGNNPTKTKAAIWAYDDGSGNPKIEMGTAATYATGVSNVQLDLCANGSSGWASMGFNQACDSTTTYSFASSAQTNGNVFNYSGSSPILTGALTGFNFDISGITATNQSVTGYQLSLPGATNTGAAAKTYKGLVLTSGPIAHSSGAGTDTFTGLDLTMPAITQTAGTVTSYGIKVTGGTVTSGTAYALVTNASAGNVGIGTTSPGATLAILGNSTASSGNTIIQSINGAQSVANTGVLIGSDVIPSYSATTGNTLAGLYGALINPVNTGTGTITTAFGVLGIPSNTSTGTIGTAYGVYGRVDNATTGTISTAYDFYAAANGGAGSNPTAKYAFVSEAGAGNVGIGTIAPVQQLDIASTGNTISAIRTSSASSIAELLFGTDQGNTEGGIFQAGSTFAGYGGANSLNILNVLNAPISLSTNNAVKMTITGAGNVGIGQTAPAQKLDVNGSALIGGNLLLATNTINCIGGISCNFNNSGTGSTNIGNVASNPVNITTGGNLNIFGTGGTSCTITPGTGMTCSSDQRLKTNVQTISQGDALNDILSLRGVTYNFINPQAPGGTHLGFIAQEVKNILPDLVTQGSDGYYQVNYANFTPVLVNAVQALNSSLSVQSDQVAGIAGNLSAMLATQSAQESEIASVQSATVANTQTLAALNGTYASSSAVLGIQTQLDAHTTQIQSLTGQVSQLTDLVNLLASNSAGFNASGSASFLSGADLDIHDATISGNLNVLGHTTLGDLGVTGNITAGLLTINGLDQDGNASINTIGDLYLQNNGTGGINLFAGKMTIDHLGNLITTGDITAKTVHVDKINVTADTTSTNAAVLSTSAGVITLPAGQTTVDVQTSALTSKSLIFTTPDSPVALGTKKISTDTFRITVTTPQLQDVKINWWIVN